MVEYYCKQCDQNCKMVMEQRPVKQPYVCPVESIRLCRWVEKKKNVKGVTLDELADMVQAQRFDTLQQAKDNAEPDFDEPESAHDTMYGEATVFVDKKFYRFSYDGNVGKDVTPNGPYYFIKSYELSDEIRDCEDIEECVLTVEELISDYSLEVELKEEV